MSGFTDVIGHEQIIWHLKNAISMGKVSHAYIFDGEAGSGKHLLSDMFAMTLQCEKGGTEPCMECHSCKQAASGNQPDIIHVHHEKPAVITVDEIRSQVNGDIQIKPYSSRYKIYIIEDADKMNVQAQNALLKTIEEPPSYAIIMLLTNQADSMLPTILSRCVRLNLKAVKDHDIKQYLMEKMGIPDYQADLSVTFAQGNVGKAVKLASSDVFRDLKSEVLSMLRSVDTMEYYEMTDAVKMLGEHKSEIDEVLDLLTSWFRDVLLFKATKDAGSLIFSDETATIGRHAKLSSYEGLQEIVEAIEKSRVRLRANVNFDLVMELLIMKIRDNIH